MADHDPLWYHTIDLPGGASTPGIFDTRRAPDYVPWPRIEGRRCLDVGTFDGFWAFELERRGAAEVVAADIDDPHALDWAYDHRRSGPESLLARRSQRGPGFTVAAEALGSNVKRVNCSVYNLDPEREGRFDVVLCGALLLHLRDPVLALERMREMTTGHLVLVEALDAGLELLAPRIAVAHVRPWYDQWWRVNSAGLIRLLEATGFHIEAIGRRFVVPLGPGAPARPRQSLVGGLAARRPGTRGILTRAVLARPRAPRDAVQ